MGVVCVGFCDVLACEEEGVAVDTVSTDSEVGTTLREEGGVCVAS